MRQQVITFIQPAKELQKGDHILHNSHAVVAIQAVQCFVSRGRSIVEIAFDEDEPTLIFEANDLILTIE